MTVSRDPDLHLTEEEQRALEEKEERRLFKVRDRHTKELRALLATEGGRAFVWRILSECGVYVSSYVGEAPLAMARNEGKRHIGLWTLREITEVDPLIYPKMQREAKERADEEEKW